MKKLMGMKGVMESRIDMCAYGMKTKNLEGTGTGLVKKPTTFITNCSFMKSYLGKVY